MNGPERRGSSLDWDDLVNAVAHNMPNPCGCERSGRGAVSKRCGLHSLLHDQTALDRLAFAASQRDTWNAQELIVREPPCD